MDAHHHDISIDALPSEVFPAVGRLNLTNYETVFAAQSEDFENIFDSRGIDRTVGAIVVVRPDQHIACVADPKDDHAVSAFLSPIFAPSHQKT